MPGRGSAESIQPVSRLPLPLQAYLSLDTYFIAQDGEGAAVGWTADA
jgi:hypothetical protein